MVSEKPNGTIQMPLKGVDERGFGVTITHRLRNKHRGLRHVSFNSLHNRPFEPACQRL